MNKLNSTKVLLNSVVRIKFFNELALKYPGHTLDLVSGRYKVPASSLMGIFSLDVSKPLILEYEDEYEDYIKDKFAQFEVE